MIRSFALMVGAVSLAVAATAAQAAPQRTPAPVSAESEALGGSPILIIGLIALLVALGIVLITDGDDEPTSP